TSISFSISQSGMVSLKVYDITGKLTYTLIDEYMNADYYNINWNASSYPSGVYLIRMDSGDFTQTQKVLLVK
ncbi:MAG: T9SS type A sorting domain-containing protein, partial [Candidatus Marinimicrobia bacterium]|nr:T9SS type A sorting domain-containing protein [Candidatus Neomarinimicrobiota bacterium]